MTIDELNALPAGEAGGALRTCVDIDSWVATLLAGRPYAGTHVLLANAHHQVETWTDAEVERALADHPRIGERTTAGSLASSEQAGMAEAGDDLERRMREGNAAYEERFGRIYLVRAAGRSAEELVAILEERLDHDERTEAAETKRQLAEIAVLRLSGMVSP